MKNLLFTLIACFSLTIMQAQNLEELKTWDGQYHLMDGERSLLPNQEETKIKTMQVDKVGTTIMLASSEHEKVTPAFYVYIKKDSDKIGKPVYFNRTGLYMVAIDKNSYVCFGVTSMLGKEVWQTLKFSNYYSKDAAKAKLMTKEKILKLAKEISAKAL